MSESLSQALDEAIAALGIVGDITGPDGMKIALWIVKNRPDAFQADNSYDQLIRILARP